uniref:Reverse transcriptase/retrotransposon-derived protein RNase H-like domain-containing protein n=1 Tax=Romanomermis culicivorax TaxID=13658 RepID=A0A915KPB6_ROMCU
MTQKRCVSITQKAKAVGLMQWCKRFILQLATLSSPLCVLLRHDSNYKFADNHKKAFDGIKLVLTSGPFLNHPIYDGKAQFIIQIDANTTAIRAILYQESGDDKWVIAYNSSILADAQT